MRGKEDGKNLDQIQWPIIVCSLCARMWGRIRLDVGVKATGSRACFLSPCSRPPSLATPSLFLSFSPPPSVSAGL
jgi:hypothetical protein